MRVLHVTECFDGGVSRAIAAVCANSPHHEHFLLYKGLDAPENIFSSIERVDFHALRADEWRRAVSQMSARLQPDIIHAHSSWAGLHCRLPRCGVPVVYEPHCFAFDMRTPLRPVYRAAERLAAGNTAAYLTLTEHEAAQARALSTGAPVFVLPNVATLPVADTPPNPPNTHTPTIVMVGRVCAQKDPRLFAAIARLAPPGWRFVWVGDGDAQLRAHLSAAGVRVTGWLDPDQLTAELRTASAYLHTAAWEGFPLSVLDADACGLPVIARRIPAFTGTPAAVFDTAAEAVDQVAAALAAPFPVPGSQFPGMTRQAQRAVLDEAYAAAAAYAATHRRSARVTA